MKTRTEKILGIMKFVSWFAFIALVIQAGVFLFSYFLGIANPSTIRNLEAEFDVAALYDFSSWNFTTVMSLLFAIIALKAYIALLVIRILSGINLANPFTLEMTRRLDRISYTIFGTWIVALIYNTHASWVARRAEIDIERIPTEFIFLAGVVFIISQVFKRGVEIQTENELTV